MFDMYPVMARCSLFAAVHLTEETEDLVSPRGQDLRYHVGLDKLSIHSTPVLLITVSRISRCLSKCKLGDTS